MLLTNVINNPFVRGSVASVLTRGIIGSLGAYTAKVVANSIKERANQISEDTLNQLGRGDLVSSALESSQFWQSYSLTNVGMTLIVGAIEVASNGPSDVQAKIANLSQVVSIASMAISVF